jgi:hypothetical protein
MEHIMKFDLGAIVRNPDTDARLVVTDHVWADGMAYCCVDPNLPYRPWVVPREPFEATHHLLERPFYEVGKLNPTTWSVHYPAPGRNELKHVFAAVNTLFAARRLAVTQNVLRAAAMRP